MAATSPSPIRATTRPRTMASLGLVLLLVVLAYWPGLHGGFVFDDFPNIVDNLALRIGWSAGWQAWLAAAFSSPSSELQRPLAMLTFALNIAGTGLDPFWMKLTNLGIHLANTVLVFFVARRLAAVAERGTATPSAWWPVLVAALWALNPINLMPVLLVVQRMESLAQVFVLGGLLLYLQGRMRQQDGLPGWTRILPGLVGGTALGALAKESAVLLPVYALLVEWAVLRFRGTASERRGLVALYGAVLLIPAVVGLAWLLPGILRGGAYTGREFTLIERLLTEGRVLVDYVRWTLVPDPSALSLYHDDYVVSKGLWSPPATLAALLLLAALATLGVRLRARRPLVALGIAWFFAAHLLTATVVPLELVYEHRNYFASFGMMLVVADFFLRPPLARWRKPLAVAACALVLLYGGLTALRASEWTSPLRFALAEAAKHPKSPRATYDVARQLIILGEYQPESPFTRQAWPALRKAMAAPGASTLPETAALLVAARTGAPVDEAWWRSLERKLHDAPIGAQEQASLAALTDCSIRNRCHFPPETMVDTFLAALHDPPSAEVLNVYGNYALNVLHEPALAERLWRGAATRAPRVVEYQAALAKLMIATGRPAQALPYIARVRQLGRLGQNEQAARELEQRLPLAMRPTQPQEARR